jgi:hypothetical protein
MATRRDLENGRQFPSDGPDDCPSQTTTGAQQYGRTDRAAD